MTERELLNLWTKARLHVILAQLAPTLLLGLTVWLMVLGLGEAPDAVRWAALGILLASGILGALAEYAAATEALAVSRDLQALETSSHVTQQVVRFAKWMHVVRFVTPAIFIVIFVFLAVGLI